MRLEDKVAIVTGGAQGIGRAVVKRFAQEGATVIIADRAQDAGQSTLREVEQGGGNALFLPIDVGDPDQAAHLADETVRRFGRIDILVNNAGITGENGPFLEVTQEIWERILRVNQSGVFYCGQAAARYMAAAGGGVIINISSTNGQIPQPHCVAYAAAKAAVESITRSMAIDLAHFNIRANAIAPGPIQSRAPDDAPTSYTSRTLLERTGLPAEVAAVAVFLASDDASYVTGERIAVDGGKLVNAYEIYGYSRPESARSG